MPFRNQHNCTVDSEATEVVQIKKANTPYGELHMVYAKKGDKVVLRGLRIPANVPVHIAKNLCQVRGGEFSPATPLNPKDQMLSEEYCFWKMTKENQRLVLDALVKDFEMPDMGDIITTGMHLSESFHLDDDAFALVLPGGVKDKDGRTVPRGLRRLPYKNARGTIQVDLLASSLSRFNEVAAPASLRKKALTKLLRGCKSIGMEVQEKDKFPLSHLYFYLGMLEKVGG